jgi:hypothetical protein
MRSVFAMFAAGVLCAALAAPVFAATTEDFRNEKVFVTEVRLAPGEHEALNGKHPSVLVYLSGDAAQIKFADGKTMSESVVRGRTLRVNNAVLTNTGHKPLHLVSVEFLTDGSNAVWGRDGFAPTSQLIFEDRYSRTYNIRVAAHAWEPLHTHHDRVTVCLQGAHLEHILPDGSDQQATLKTDEVAWRLAQTHKGHNLGDTNLWVVAIEPK